MVLQSLGLGQDTGQLAINWLLELQCYLAAGGSGIRRPTMADQCECRVRRQNLFKRTRKAKILNPGLQAKGRGHSVLLPHLQDESDRARLQEASGVLFSWNKASRSIIV